ncbi:MAG TPA: hypothetical protein ENI23_16045 [bacterium]|nr:hypothetical protein [bacterium]
MPISKINPDGTVNIYNTKTGEVRDSVKPEDLAAISPKLVAAYQEMQDPELIVARKEAEQALGDIEAGKIPKSPSDKAKFIKAKKLLNQLYEIYYGKPGEESLAQVDPGAFRLPAQMQALGVKIKAGKANSVEERIFNYNRILESKRAGLAKAAGDAGNLALQEQIMAGKGLPGSDSTPNEAAVLFGSSFDFFADGEMPDKLVADLKILDEGGELSKIHEPIEPVAPTGTQPTGVQSADEQGKGGIADISLGDVGGAIKKALGSLGTPGTFSALDFPIVGDVAFGRSKDVREKLRSPDESVSLDEAVGAGGELARNLAFSAGGILPAVAGGVVGGATTPGADVKGRAINAALEGILGGGVGAAGKLLSKVPGLFKPKLGKEVLTEGTELAGKGSAERNAAIELAMKEGKKIEGNNFFKAITEWAEQAKRGTLKSSDIKAIDDVVANAKRFKGKKFTPDTVKGIWDTANEGFTAAGKIGNTVTAEFNRVLRNVARGELDKVAPGFESGTKAIREGLQRQKVLDPIKLGLEREGVKSGLKTPIKEFLKKAIFPTALSAGVGIPLSIALSKILGQDRQ